MPQVIVKLSPSKSDAQKRDLTDVIVRGLNDIPEYGEESVSVGFEEVSPNEWSARVYDPDIRGD